MEGNYYNEEDILNSLKGIQRAEPNPFLFARIESKLDQASNGYLPLKKLSLVAIGLVLLIAINAWAIINLNRNSTNGTEGYSISYFQRY